MNGDDVTNLNTLTLTEMAAEAARLRAAGYDLTEIDGEDWRENETVQRQFARRVRLGFSDVYRFTTPDEEAFVYFVGGARGADALISLTGAGTRRAADRSAAALLASQV